MSIVVQVSKAGKDVLGTSNIPNDYIFDSRYNTFKILAEGTLALTLGENPFSIQEGTVAHGQSGIPFVIGYCKYGDRVFSPGHMIYHGGTAPAYSTFFSDIYVNDTNILFQYGNQQSGVNVVFKYIIVEPPL
jgi:hypothetical protein